MSQAPKRKGSKPPKSAARPPHGARRPAAAAGTRAAAKRPAARARTVTPAPRALPPARAVVFDFDGVLFDTESLHLVAMQAAASGWGYTLDRSEYLDRYAGFDDRDLARTFLRDRRNGVDPSPEEIERLMAEKSRRFDALLPEARPFPGVVALVAGLAARAVPLAVCSGSWREEIDRLLAAAGMSGAFEIVVAADDTPRGKPDPAGYLYAARKLGAPPGLVVAVEDTPDGVSAARSAGLRVVGVAHTYPPEHLTRAGAGLVVPRIGDLGADRLLGRERPAFS
ncbi:MAG TPA: HAD family phosphatase [Myxococcota bacterium]|jgi:HAD superfamily hydrolase (TIGR01509 family)|nr:HAD family phosphatase [Myxococcota bacterium]